MKILLTWFLLFSFTACTSLSSMQTARPLKEGAYSMGLGIGYQSVKLKDPAKEEIDKESAEDSEALIDAIEEIKMPMIDFMIQYGINDKFSIAAKSTSLLAYGLDLKYNLINNSNFALALGTNANYSSMESSSTGSESKFTLIDLGIPLHLSYDFNDVFGIYFTPRYVNRGIHSKLTDKNEVEPDTSTKASSSTHMYGASTGFFIGWFLVEASFISSAQDADSGLYQFMIAYWSGWDKVVRPKASGEKKKKTKKKKKKIEPEFENIEDNQEEQ